VAGPAARQPPRLDRKTSEHVDLLFSVRAHPGRQDLYQPHDHPRALCAKAGVPAADVRGNITSHRARSTIASQLYNAKEPMTLFELQAWLGHQNPATTQHYAKITPEHAQQGLHRSRVLRPQRAHHRGPPRPRRVTSGSAAGGEPWQYYDLGHGLCSYTFFEQCPHRMACGEMRLLHPKSSSKAQLLEARDNLPAHARRDPAHRRRTRSVDDGRAALDSLLGRLADIPTPARRHTPASSGRLTSADPPAHIEVRSGKPGMKADI